MWNNTGHSFAHEFVRKGKIIEWRGVTWLQEPTPRELTDWGRHCSCHKDENGHNQLLHGKELLDHFDNEVKIMTALVKEKFGKVKVIRGGSADNRSVVFMIERVTLKLEDERNAELDWEMDSNGFRKFNDEQKELIGTSGKAMTHGSAFEWKMRELIIESQKDHTFL